MTDEDARILATIHHLYRHLRRLPGTDGTTRQKHPAYAVIEARIRALGQRLTPSLRSGNEDPSSRSLSGSAVMECAPTEIASNSTPSSMMVRRSDLGGAS